MVPDEVFGRFILVRLDEHRCRSAWANAAFKHRTTNPANIPSGVPVFWTGGSHGFGHIAISTGAGMCWSSDIRRIGYFAHVPIAEIHDRWGLTFAGWSEDLEGVRVYSPPVAPPKEPVVKPPRKPLLPTRISLARALLVAARSRRPHDVAAINKALHDLPLR